MSAERLLALLADYRTPGAFNQYAQERPGLDRPGAAGVRRANLAAYLEAFAAARWVLVGEAAGYAGCRFSGIPFTSEAQLVGPARLAWTEGRCLAQSSAAARPWAERSAAAVWRALAGRADCLLWNAFPWHPFGAGGPLSNRPPGAALGDGLEALRCLLALFPAAQPVAVGRVAQRALARLGLDAPALRHPSHGGSRAFTAGIAGLGHNKPRRESMDKQIVATDRAPAAIGPYSQAVRAGELVFTSGQLGLVPGTKQFAGPDVESQTRQALTNLEALLEAAGSCLAHVVKTTVFLADMGEFAQMNAVYAGFFAAQPPARSTVQAAGLPMAARVEIEAVALACGCERECCCD